MPDELNQVSGSIGGPIVKDKTFFFVTADYTRAGSHHLPLEHAAGVRAAGRRQPDIRRRTTGRRSSTRGSTTSSRRRRRLMVRVNVDRFYDNNPNDAVGGTNAPSVARRYSRRAVTDDAGQSHGGALGPNLLNEARFAYLHGDPVTLWEAQNLSTTYTRAGSVPFTIGESRVSDLFGHQVAVRGHAVVVARHAHPALRAAASCATPRRHGQRARHGDARHVHVPQHDDRAVRSVDAGRRAAVHAADQLRHQQLRAVAVDVGAFVQDSIRVHDDLTVDAGPALRPADADRRHDELRAARRLRLASRRRRADWRSAAATAMYYTQIRANALASSLTGGLDGLVTYTAVPGQIGFPTCLTGRASR